MRIKRKAVIAGVIVSLTLLVTCLFIGPQVEVHGRLSKQDVTELMRLGHIERRQDMVDWSATPRPRSIRLLPFMWRHFRWDSARVVRIDQMSDNKAQVTIGTGSSMRHYEFINTKQGWETTKQAPAFE